MALSKKIISQLSEKVIFLYLLVFPFGQLLSFRINFGDFLIPIHLVDIITAISVIIIFAGRKNNSKFTKIVNGFLLLFSFSFIFSLTIFKPRDVVVGLAYLFRLFIYSNFFTFVYIYINKSKAKRRFLLHSLLLVSIVIGVFGLL